MKKDKRARAISLLDFEDIWRAEGKCIAGIDEAGRGPLAGPVFAACVVWPENWPDRMGTEHENYDIPEGLFGIYDSKKVTSAQRIRLYSHIMRNAFAVGTGMASVGEIEEINIRQATHLAMKRAAWEAIRQMNRPADIYLLDGENVDLKLPDDVPVFGIKKGDTLSFAIASASIIAKVSRDALMRNYHTRYPDYGFNKNKGYGTSRHITALREFGACPIHRPSFLRKILGETPR